LLAHSPCKNGNGCQTSPSHRVEPQILWPTGFFHDRNSVNFSEMWHICFIKTNMDDGIAFVLGLSNNYPFCPWIKKETVKG
jgi:hypothetical protein